MVDSIVERIDESSAKEKATYGAVIFVVGGGVVALALVRSSYLFAGIGLFVSLAGLYLIHLGLREFSKAGGQRSMAGFGAAGYLTGTGLITIGVSVGVGLLALAGTWIAAPSLAAMAAVLYERCQTNGARHPVRCALGGVVVTALAVATALQWDVDEVVVVALLIGLLGLTLAGLGLLALTTEHPVVWTIIGAGAIALSLLLVVGMWPPSDPVALAPVALLGGLGLVPVSKGLPTLAQEWPRFLSIAVFMGGLAFAAVATVTFSRAEWPWSWTIGVLVISALISAALVTDVVELGVLVLLGVVVAAIVSDRTDREPLSPHPDAEQRIVALGDSYMSGEGAAAFFAGTNVVGENQCRRTSSAYAYLIADRLDMDLDFLACSGARTRHIIEEGQQPNSPQSVVGATAQLDSLTDEGGDIAAVLVSIGGNDAWFATIGQACFAPGSCEVHRSTVLRNVSAIGNRLAEVYESIVERVGREVPVIAMPYPLTATEHGCDGSPLTQSEHEFLFEFTEVLNDRARAEAARAGIHWFAPGIDAFAGHRICDEQASEPAMNVVNVNPTDGSLLDRITPTNWIHGSAHPKELGHRLTADELAPWLAALWADIRTGDRLPNPEPQPNARFELTLPTPFQRVSTRSLGLPEGSPCPLEELPISALRAVSRLGGERIFSDVAPGSQVCTTTPDGSWVSVPVGDDGVASVAVWGTDVLESDDADAPGASQVLISQSIAGFWRVSVLGFCELDPACAEDAEEIEAWMYGQVADTARSTIVPAIFIFLGTWFAAMEVRRVLTGRKHRRLDPRDSTGGGDAGADLGVDDVEGVIFEA